MHGISMPSWPSQHNSLSLSVSGSVSLIGAESFADQLPLDSNAPYRAMLLLLLLAHLWTLLLTTVPVVTSLPPSNYYAGHRDWYTGDDVMRLVEPIGGTFLQCAVFAYSGILREEKASRSAQLCACLFLLGLALYHQGAGFHSASNMFKNALETEMVDENDSLDALFYYTRVVWQHAVSHYLYAAGYALMCAAQLYAYRLVRAPYVGLTKKGAALLLLSSLVYAALMALVAVEFPSGTIVALAYLVVYGLGGIGGYVVYQRCVEGDVDIVRFGQRPVLHHFLLAHVLALAMVVAWIIAVGGFKDRAQAGFL